MARNSWLETHSVCPTACREYEYVWVSYASGLIQLVKEKEGVRWEQTTHWQPTQIRTPKPLKQSKK